MKLTCSKSKNSCTYYVQKSVRIGDRTTTKPVERLGSIEEIKSRCGDQDPIEWAREYTKKLTLAEKEAKKGVLLKLSSSMLIDKNIRYSCNAGYLFLQDIYYSLGLDKTCRSISEKYTFDYDLNDILSMLVYSRIIAPASKLSSLESARRFLEQPKCELHMILFFFCLDFTITGISHQTSNKYNHIHPSFPPFLLHLLPYWQHKSTADQIRNKNQSAAQLLLSAALAITRAVIISENSARLSFHMCNPFQGSPNPFTPLQAVSAISCMVFRFLTLSDRHHREYHY